MHNLINTSYSNQYLLRKKSYTLLLVFILFLIYSAWINIEAVSCVDLAYVTFTCYVFICMMIIYLVFNGDLFHPILQYIFFSLISDAVVPAFIIISNYDNSGFYQSSKLVLFEASVYKIIALLSLYCGYKSQLTLDLTKAFPGFNRTFYRNRVLVFIVLCLSASVLSISYIIYQRGGIISYLIGLSNRIVLFMNYAYITEIIKLSQLSLYIYYIYFYIKNKKTLRNAIAITLIMLITVIANLLTGSRGELIKVIITLIFIYNYYVRRIKFRDLLLPIMFCLLIFTVLGNIREQLSGMVLYGEKAELNESLIKHVMASAEGFTTFSKLTASVPGKTGYYYGKTYMESPLSLIPRALYPDKPVGASWELNKIIADNEFIYSTDINVPLSGSGADLIHESYLNFGVIGIVVAFFIQGVLYSAYYRLIIDSSMNNYKMLLCTYVYSLISIGESFGYIIKILVTITPLLLFYYFAKKHIIIK